METTRISLIVPKPLAESVRRACAQNTLITGQKTPVNTWIVNVIQDAIERRGEKSCTT